MTAGGRRPVPWYRHPWVRHLRLPFNALLSPIYLWGVWSAPAVEDPWRVALGWIALHVFLYGGTTALNSSVDRDEGPIGGMRHPEPVDGGLMRWSVLVQLAGLPLAWAVGPAFLVTYVVLGVLAAAYSLPVTRWKSSTVGSLAVVALGQGGVGSLAGWWAAVGPDAAPGALLASAGPWWAALAAGALVVGQYVVSQAYQVDEDARRGDRTLPVLLGPRRALRVALIPSALGVLVMLGAIALRSGWWWALPGAALGALLSLLQWRWSARVGEDLDADYASAMGLVRLGGVGIGAYLLVLLVAT